MKKQILLLLLLSMASKAQAGGGECDWAIQVAKDVRYAIDQNNARINLLNSLITRENSVLQKELAPQRKELANAVSVYDFKSRTSVTAHATVQNAITLIKSSILSNEKIKRTIDRIGRSGQLLGGPIFSKQLRDQITKIKMENETRNVINQLINSTELIETAQTSWQESVKQLLKEAAEGKVSLADGLVEQLRAQNQQLESDLNQLATCQSQDSQRLKQLDGTIIDVQNKVAGYGSEVAALQATNAQKAAYRSHWSVERWCPRYDLRPSPGIRVY